MLGRWSDAIHEYCHIPTPVSHLCLQLGSCLPRPCPFPTPRSPSSISATTAAWLCHDEPSGIPRVPTLLQSHCGELSPWFWPVNQPLVLGLSLWAGAHRSQVSPSWRSLNQRWAGAESVPENEHTAHPRPPPHAPHRCQALRMSGRHTEHFLLVCTNLNTSISQSQKEFEAQVFKDPNEFNEV